MNKIRLSYLLLALALWLATPFVYAYQQGFATRSGSNDVIGIENKNMKFIFTINKLLIIFTLCILFEFTGIISNASATIYYGETYDKSGDADYSGGGDGDLIFASISFDKLIVKVNTRFAPGTFSSNSVMFQVGLDTDQLITTGHPGVNGSGIDDSEIIGVDYIVNYDPTLGAALVLKYAGIANSFNLINSTSSIYFGQDQVWFEFPRIWLDNDEGAINFKVTSAKLIQPDYNGYTNVLDYMSDIGLPAASTSAVPIPNTMLFFFSVILFIFGMRIKWKKFSE